MPLIGILKTKQQVFDAIRSIDSSKVDVDFDSFSKAIYNGQFANQDKLRKLQGFCENMYGFHVDTLFSIERRKLLLSTIMDQNLNRRGQVDQVWAKPLSYEGKMAELRTIEDAHTTSLAENDAYIEELKEALELNKKDRMLKDMAHARDLEKLSRMHQQQARLNPIQALTGSHHSGSASTVNNYRRSLRLSLDEPTKPPPKTLPPLGISSSKSVSSAVSFTSSVSCTSVAGKSNPFF